MRLPTPSPHRDHLLAAGRVYGNAVVEIGLGGAHLHGNAEPLQHLVAAHALHVKADDLRRDRKTWTFTQTASTNPAAKAPKSSRVF